MVSICDEIALSPCVDGDVVVISSGVVEIKADLIGYFAPVNIDAVRSWAESVHSDELQRGVIGSPTVEKDTSPGLWQTGLSEKIFYSGGNIGIGTDKPNGELVVTHDPAIGGESQASTTIDSSSDQGSSWALHLRAPSLSGPINDLMVVRGDGKVGIGTRAPQAELHVADKSFLEGDVVLPDNGYVRGQGAKSGTADGGLFFSASTPGSSGAHSMDGTPGYGAYMNHNVYWNGNEWIRPRGAMESQVFTVNHHHSTSWWRAPRGGADHSPVSLELSMLIEASSGHVGIGVADPEKELEINGGLQLAFNRHEADESRWRFSPWPNGNLGIDTPMESPGLLHLGRDSASKTVVGYHNNPPRKFNVVGGSYFEGQMQVSPSGDTSGEALRVDGDIRLENIGGDVELQFVTWQGGNNTKIVKSGGGNALYIKRMNDSKLYTFAEGDFIVHGADVGLGRTDPQVRLDVKARDGEDLQLRLTDGDGAGAAMLGYSNDLGRFVIQDGEAPAPNAFSIDSVAGPSEPVFRFDTASMPAAVTISGDGELRASQVKIGAATR
ncbi:MAG: hypothetical protein AAFX50_13170, partial [Acidobacteriota bacterium]